MIKYGIQSSHSIFVSELIEYKVNLRLNVKKIVYGFRFILPIKWYYYYSVTAIV